MPDADRLALVEQLKELRKFLLAEENPETNNFLIEHQLRLALARVQRTVNQSYYTTPVEEATVEEAEARYAQACERLEMAHERLEEAELCHAISKQQIEAKKAENAILAASSPSLVHS
jgi:hypothetical protein